MSNSNRKPMKLFEMLTMVVGTMVGIGIFIAPALNLASGFYGPISCMLAGILCIGLSMMFGELSKMNATGGPAGFAYKAFGRMMAMRVAVLHWLGFTAAQVLTVSVVGFYSNQTFAYSIGITMLLLVALINIYKPSIADQLQAIFTILKVGLVLFVIFAGFRLFSFSEISFKSMSMVSKSKLILSGVASSLIAFAGLELATLPSCEIENPRFTVPAATILGTIITALLSAAAYLVIINALIKFDVVIGNRPVYDAISIIAGKFITVFMIAFVISCLSSINGVLNAQAYILKNASDLRVAPAVFAETNAHGKSVYSVLTSVCSTIICLALMKFNFISTVHVGAVSSVAFTLVYLYSAASYYKLTGCNLLSVLNILVCILLVYGIASSSLYLAGIMALVSSADVLSVLFSFKR